MNDKHKVWEMVAMRGGGPAVTMEVWNKATPDDPCATYIDLTLTSDDASFTYRMDDAGAKDLIGYLRQALEYSGEMKSHHNGRGMP